MATSIDQSVNWRKSADKPDYQTSNTRVDTYVQPERNTKGKQVAAALEQAAGTVGQVGDKLLKDKRQRQLAALEDTALKMSEKQKTDKKYDYLTDPEFLGHTPTMQIQLAQAIGKSRKYGFTTDSEGNKVEISFTEIEDHLSKNPDIALDAKKLSDYLAGINVPLESEDGVSLNLEAQHRASLEEFKQKIQAQGVGLRKQRDIAQAEWTYKQGFLEIFQGDGTNAEKWQKAAEFDKNFKDLALHRRNPLVYEVSKDHAEATKDAGFLIAEQIPTVFKNAGLDYVRRNLNDRLSNENKANQRFDSWLASEQKAQELDRMQTEFFEMSETRFVSSTEYKDPAMREWAYRQNSLGANVDFRDAEPRFYELQSKLEDMALSNEPLMLGDKEYPKSEEGYRAYIMNYGGLQRNHVTELLKSTKRYAEGANIRNNPEYQNVFDNIVVPTLKTVYGSADSKDQWVKATKLDLEKEFLSKYLELKKDGFSGDDRVALESFMVQRANTKVEYKKIGQTEPDNPTTDEPSKSSDELNDVLDQMFKDNLTNDEPEATTDDSADGSPNPRIEQSNKTPTNSKPLGLSDDALDDLFNAMPTVSAEMFEGLTDAEIMEAYGDDIKRASKKIKRSEAIAKWLDENTAKPQPEMTSAQQAYFDRTGKLPASVNK